LYFDYIEFNFGVFFVNMRQVSKMTLPNSRSTIQDRIRKKFYWQPPKRYFWFI